MNKKSNAEEMDNLKPDSIAVLPKSQWTSLDVNRIDFSKSKKETVGNTTALIVSALTETFPELARCPDGKFISYQEKVTKIISRLN